MSTAKPQFDIRMLYAITPELRERAAALDCNWALVYSCGHKHHRSLQNPLPKDDLPIWFDSNPAIASLRRQQHSAGIRFEQDTLRAAVTHAKELGLKTMMHTYEVSIPHEFKTLYPDMYRPMLKEYRDCSPETMAQREPCLSDPNVREIISQKVAETVLVAPELDAYCFSFNECLSMTKIPHRCDLCRDIPFWQMIKWLADAVEAGIRASSSTVQFWHRLWGLNEHDFKYYDSIKCLHDFAGDDCQKLWMPRHVEVYKPRNLHYKPSEDLQKYLELQKTVDMGFVAKGSWGDVSIDMPLNPWIPELKPHPTVVELSFESPSCKIDGFHVLAGNFQRMARYARDQKAIGVAGIPVDWGDKHNENPPPRGFVDESYWRLSVLNFDVYAALAHDPEADMLAVVEAALAKRYGCQLPTKLAELVLESQQIKADTLNVRGIRGNGASIEAMYYQLLRYGPTVDDWQARISRDPANVERILVEKDATMRRAEQILTEIQAFEGQIPATAYAEFVSSFTDLRDTAVKLCQRQKFNFLLWALKDGTMPCTTEMVHRLEACIPQMNN